MSERASFAVGESARLILLRCPRRHLLLSPARPRRRPRPLWLRREPTPAALQFKRWDAPIPKNRADLQKLKTEGENIKERLAPKLGKK